LYEAKDLLLGIRELLDEVAEKRKKSLTSTEQLDVEELFKLKD